MVKRVVSVNVGLPRTVQWRGEIVSTGIFKQPVAGRVAVRRLNLEGDRQADLTVHGGPDKAVYAYPAEHYPYWRDVLPSAAVSWAAFGENLTTEGLLEAEVRIGDRFRVGSAELIVTQPRTPCYKLGIRFGRPDMARLFLRSKRPGFYFAVAREGVVEAGDAIALIGRDEASLTVAEIAILFAEETADPDLLRRATELAGLPDGWRNQFRAQIARLDPAPHAATRPPSTARVAPCTTSDSALEREIAAAASSSGRAGRPAGARRAS